MVIFHEEYSQVPRYSSCNLKIGLVIFQKLISVYCIPLVQPTNSHYMVISPKIAIIKNSFIWVLFFTRIMRYPVEREGRVSGVVQLSV